MEYTRRLKGVSKATAEDIPIKPIVSYYGGEVRDGKEVSVRCVMHADTRRSASMNTYDNLYYCFTCGKGGNAVNIVCIMENLEYKDGIKRATEIAERSGEPIRSGHNRRNARHPKRSWNI